MTMARLARLYYYPVKGLTPHPLADARLVPGQTLPFDRKYALENGAGKFDPAQPRHLPKVNFLMLMRHEQLAELVAQFDPASEYLTIRRQGKVVAEGDLRSAGDRDRIAHFFGGFVEPAKLKGAPHFVEADDHSFSDVAEKCLHIVNLASVAAIADRLGQPLDPLRFRANLYIEGLPAFAELDWAPSGDGPGARLNIGDQAQLQVFKRTERCAATNVDPQTGQRDRQIPEFLASQYGHRDVGIYATIVRGGQIAAGDPVVVV